jgi:hypothetical protein
VPSDVVVVSVEERDWVRLALKRKATMLSLRRAMVAMSDPIDSRGKASTQTLVLTGSSGKVAECVVEVSIQGRQSSQEFARSLHSMVCDALLQLAAKVSRSTSIPHGELAGDYSGDSGSWLLLRS